MKSATYTTVVFLIKSFLIFCRRYDDYFLVFDTPVALVKFRLHLYWLATLFKQKDCFPVC